MSDDKKTYPNLTAALVAVDLIKPKNRPHVTGDTCNSRSDINEISVTLAFPSKKALGTDVMAKVRTELDRLMLSSGVIFRSETDITTITGMTVDKPFDAKVVKNLAYCLIEGESNLQQAQKALQDLGKGSPVFGNKEIIRGMQDTFQKNPPAKPKGSGIAM